MSSVSPKQGRLTNEAHLGSIKNGLTEGFRAGWEACIRASQARIAAKIGVPKEVSDWDWEIKNALQENVEGLDDFNATKMMESFLEDVDLWSMDPREDKEIAEKKPRKKKDPEDGAEEKPKPAKKSSGAWVDDPELANKPFDPEFCNCRKWNKGFGAQCNRAVAEDGLCSMHKKQYDKIIENGGQDLSHGRYNEERPEKCLTKPEREHVHPWKDLVKTKDEDTDEKKREKKEKKGKKEKKVKKEKKAKKGKKVKKEKDEKDEKDGDHEQPIAEQVAEAVEAPAEIVEHVIEDAVKEAVEAAEKVEHAIEDAVKDVAAQVQENDEEGDEEEEKTQELEDDGDGKDLTKDSTELKEIDYNGQTYLLNTATKDVIDADDGEKVGTATLDDEGGVQKIDFEGDDDEDSDDDSDDDSDYDSDDEE